MFMFPRPGTERRAIESALAVFALWLISATGEVLVWVWDQYGSPPLLFAVSTHLLAAVSFSSLLLLALEDAVQRLRSLLSELRRTFGSPARRRS